MSLHPIPHRLNFVHHFINIQKSPPGFVGIDVEQGRLTVRGAISIIGFEVPVVMLRIFSVPLSMGQFSQMPDGEVRHLLFPVKSKCKVYACDFFSLSYDGLLKFEMRKRSCPEERLLFHVSHAIVLTSQNHLQQCLCLAQHNHRLLRVLLPELLFRCSPSHKSKS